MNGLEILKWLKNCWGWDTRDREQAYRASWLRIDLLKIETGWGAAIGDVQSCIFSPVFDCDSTEDRFF